MKRILSLLLSFCMIVGLLPSLGVTAASPESDFTFNALTGTITEYTGPPGNVDIPAEIGGIAVTVIGDDAFFGCWGLTSVTIPDGITIIGNSAFYGCTGLTNVTIPDSVTTIEDSAFRVTGLTSIIFKSPITTIYDSENTIPAAAKILGYDPSTAKDYAVKYNRTFEVIATTEDDFTFNLLTGTITGYTGYNSNVEIPTEIDGIVVKVIGEYAFQNCTGLTSIIIPDSVTVIEMQAFYNCIGLTSIIIPDSVTAIGMQAFYNCTGLTSIMFNSSTTTIYDNESTISPVTIIIGSSPSTTKDYAVKYNRTFYTFEPSTGTIAGYIGSGDDVLIPAEIGGIIVKVIGEYAFQSCIDLTSVTIPGSVTTVGDSAFADCSGLTSIYIPDGVTTIGDSAFADCSGLTSVTIPHCVTVIGNSAFSDCFGLTTITFNSPTTIIHDDENTIPTAAKIIGYDSSTAKDYAVKYNRTFEVIAASPENDFTFDPSTGTITGYTGPGGDVVIPATIDEIAVVTIGDNAFYDCTGLTSIYIPDSVTTIGSYVFYSCTGLTSIIIPDSVTVIGDYSFYNCTSLTSIIIPDSVTVIGNYLFYECTGLTNIILPDSVTVIGGYSFVDCTSLTNVIIPDNVTHIGEAAFSNCIGLTSVIIPDSVIIIWNYVFYYCTSLVSITFNSPTTIINDSKNTIPPTAKIIGYDSSTAKDYAVKYNRTFEVIAASPENDFTFDPSTGTITGYTGPGGDVVIPIKIGGIAVTIIGDTAFSNCIGLTSIYIPDSVTIISYSAFSNCTGLTSIYIPDSVTTIGDIVFAGCSGLRSIIVHLGNTIYKSESNCLIEIATNKLILGCKTSIIPDSVTIIGNGAFQGCIGLTSIIIPTRVTVIGEWSFAYCTGLTSMNIPDSVTTIGDAAFAYCTGLISITFNSTATIIYDSENTIPAAVKIIGYDPSTAKGVCCKI